jgi:hypothetical protein
MGSTHWPNQNNGTRGLDEIATVANIVGVLKIS